MVGTYGMKIHTCTLVHVKGFFWEVSELSSDLLRLLTGLQETLTNPVAVNRDVGSSGFKYEK